MKGKLLLLSFTLGLMFFSPLSVSGQEIIRTQSQFDSAIRQINSGKAKDIFLMPGRYVMNERIIAKSPLTITSDSATISDPDMIFQSSKAYKETNTHYVYKLDKHLSLFSLFTDDTGNIIPVSETVDISTRVNNSEEGVIGNYQYKAGVDIKIPLSSSTSHLKNRSFNTAFGYFDCGWTRVLFEIQRSDSKYLYCRTLSKTNTNAFNYEKSVYKKAVRYVVYNAELKDDGIYYDDQYLYIPKQYSYVKTVLNPSFDNQRYSITTYSDVIIKGIKFETFNGLSMDVGLNNRCEVDDCSFINTLNTALNIVKKNGEGVVPSVIKDCVFQHCSVLDGYIVNLKSEWKNKTCITMSNCNISRYHDSKVYYKNSDAAVNVNADALLIDNTVFNTSRAHFYFSLGEIKARHNVLYNSKEFNSYKERNLSSDFGLVYCNHTYSDAEKALSNSLHTILIDNNLIYGAYAFGGDARGIMIDDGRGDVVCKNNAIFDVQYFTIDSRYPTKYSASSVRNQIYNNVLEGRYRLEGGSELSGSNSPKRGSNILLGDYKNAFNGKIIEDSEDQVLKISGFYNSEGKVHVSKTDYKKLKKTKNFHSIKGWLKK